jgi:hypothetical protein
MVGLRTVTLAISSCALLALLGLDGCVATRGSLASSADALEHNAYVLARDARDERVSSDYPLSYARDARELADEAHEFRHAVLYRGAGDVEVERAFERLSRSYHVVRDEVDHSGSREAQINLKPVTDSYLDIEREMGGYPERHARADYRDRSDR